MKEKYFIILEILKIKLAIKEIRQAYAVRPYEIAMKTKFEKQQIVKEIKELFNKSSRVIFISLLKIPAESQKFFKEEIKKVNGIFKVFKKTLIKKSFQELPIDLEKEDFKQPFGIIFDFNPNEEIKLLKALTQIAEKIQLNIIKGISGNNILEKETIFEIGRLPSIEILRQKLLLVFKTKTTQPIFVFKLPLIKFTMVVSNIKK